MTYYVFGGMLNLAQSINQIHYKKNYRMLCAGCGGDVANESSREEAPCTPGTTGEHARRRPPL